MTVKGPDHTMRLISRRTLGGEYLEDHLEKDNSWGWILVGSNGSGKESSRLSFQQMDYCLILQIEEMKHRETMGWLIVENESPGCVFWFPEFSTQVQSSSSTKSCCKHPQGRAYTSHLLYVCGFQSSPFADPFTFSNRGVHLNLLTTGLLSLAFLHILHVARGSSWVCSLWLSADSYVPLSSHQSLHKARASSRHFQSGPNSI